MSSLSVWEGPFIAAPACMPLELGAAISGLLPGSLVCAAPAPLTSDMAKIRTAICASNFFSIGFIQFSLRFSLKRGPLLAQTAREKWGPRSEDFGLLSVNSPLADGVGHAINGQNLGRDAVVDLVGFRITDHIFERRYHDALQLLVDY